MLMFEDFLGHGKRMKQVENILSFRRLRDRLHQRLLVLFKKRRDNTLTYGITNTSYYYFRRIKNKDIVYANIFQLIDHQNLGTSNL